MFTICIDRAQKYTQTQTLLLNSYKLNKWRPRILIEHLTYVEVIVRNRSCPAVSQICSFTLSPLISNVRILKSTPIVVIYVPVITENTSSTATKYKNCTLIRLNLSEAHYSSRS